MNKKHPAWTDEHGITHAIRTASGVAGTPWCKDHLYENAVYEHQRESGPRDVDCMGCLAVVR